MMDNKSPAPSLNDSDPLIDATFPHSVTPSATNMTKLSYEQSLQVFAELFEKLDEQIVAHTNVARTAVDKAMKLVKDDAKIVKEEEALFKRISMLAEDHQRIQAMATEHSDKADALIKRVDRVHCEIPKDRLTQLHRENEERVVNLKESVGSALDETRETALQATLLRSEYVSRQPSFTPSVDAARFMLTKNGVDANELENETAVLERKITQLMQVAEQMKNEEDC